MNHRFILALCMALLLVATGASATTTTETVQRDYQIAMPSDAGLVQHSSGSIMGKAQADTFYIYGGPANVPNFGDPAFDGVYSVDGMFQTLSQNPGGTPDLQGWTTYDITEVQPHWRATTTQGDLFGANVPGNHVVAANHDGADYFGYGNGWDDWLVIKLDVAALGYDPGADDLNVRYTCQYKYATEPGYDFLLFEWNQGGAWQELLAETGNSLDTLGVYQPVDFDSDTYGGITYTPADYIDGTIQLRIRVTSDTAWSDEDGLYPTGGLGAAFVDDITIYVGGTVVSIADWEPLSPKLDLGDGDITGVNNGADVGTAGWEPVPNEFVGDFGKLFAQFQDIDPCRDNVTPQIGWIDDGTPPNNDPQNRSTGGSVSPTWTYGIQGGYVINYSGGLSNGQAVLNNEIWSPEIAWDLPGTEDDVVNGGALIRWTTWSHMPVLNGFFYQWHVRSYTTAAGWSSWQDRNFIYYSNAAAYGNNEQDVTDLLRQNPEKVQMAFGVLDYHIQFELPGGDATPAPLFDNVMFKKYVVGGPVMSTRNIDLFSDSFPNDGSLNGSCRIDMNRDIHTGDTVNLPGDSIIVDIVAVIPGTALPDTTGGLLKVAHLANPFYATQRTAALTSLGATVAGTDPQTGWDIYTYEVPGAPARNQFGGLVEDRYFFDLPDGPANVNAPHQVAEDPLFFPGDVIHYYIEATDDALNVSTFPSNITGFTDFAQGTLYNRVWTIRALPTQDETGAQVNDVLFWNDFGHRGGEEEYLQAFNQIGMLEGVHFDTYTTKGPSSGVGNGLGSAGHHGANVNQMAGYKTMVYVSGNLTDYLISDGSNVGSNDKGDDISLLTGWHNATADRFHVYFGDDFADGMLGEGLNGQTYINTVLGVDAVSGDVGPKIDGQTAALVQPTDLIGASIFNSDYIAYGGCLVINDFDEIAPYGTGPVIGHEFTDANGNPYGTTVPGSVIWDRLEGGFRKVTATFPYDLLFVRNPLGTTGTGVAARSTLLGEVLTYMLGSVPGGTQVGTEPVERRLLVNQNYPNPFNPSTTIKFYVPAKGDVKVKVYNVKGELVRTLQDGVMDAGWQTIPWMGKDGNGATCATGVYLYKVSTNGQEVVKKMALMK